MSEFTVRNLFEEQKDPLRLEMVAGERALDNLIPNPHLQKYSLAFSGFYENFHPDRVQVLGETELRYLATLSADDAREAIRTFCAYPVCCIFVTKGLDVPADFIDAAEQSGIPMLRSALQSSWVISHLSAYLEARLARGINLHGVLIDVDDVGLLILGKSGIGKSESALHLVQRGHRLVADDVVQIRRNGDLLIGRGMELSRYHMEIRGLGILDIRDLFGVVSIREEKRIELVVRLEEWDPEEEYERLGLDDPLHEILGVSLPLVRLPVKPGRNIPTLLEVASRNHLLKTMGHRSAEAFNEDILKRLAETAGPAGPENRSETGGN
ncbi:MAG: HPr(Ser) kinase/phosphatase [Nitrospinota bacterium]|jgi:HPr kinase/phosphorylase|nr:HPr(Ser) kinase/phosphatase [Nitrospinota bacterium]MDP7385172.1 HPr(Ser) kinase/phosphatase [Nitrospinota bacterium]